MKVEQQEAAQKETRAERLRRTRRIWFVAIAVAVLIMFVAWLCMVAPELRNSVASPGPRIAAPTQPVSSYPAEIVSAQQSLMIFLTWLDALGIHSGSALGHHLDMKTVNQAREWARILFEVLKVVAVIGIGLFIFAVSTRRKYVEIDKLGILIADKRNHESPSGKFIPWGCLEKIEVVDFDLAGDSAADASVSDGVTQDKSPATKAKLLLHVDDGNIVKVRWSDVIRCVEPGHFINALKTYAPEACPRFEALAGQAHHVDNTSYTQLWFRYYSVGASRKRSAHLVAGDTLRDGRFVVVGLAGSGGQGTAYIVSDLGSERQPADSTKEPAVQGSSEVILKEYILPVHRGQQALRQTSQKLEQEAAILRKLDHPNVVKLQDAFIEDHRGYLVMEYVHGKSLKELVGSEGPQSESFVLDLARQLLDVLSYLHCQDPPIIHRDLTPDNLILQSDGRVKLVDFNVAHQLESAATATVVGKHAYIPPEQFRGKPTPQSDIYALGCTLHYLLTGMEPEPLTVSQPRAFRDTVSQGLNDIIACATMSDASQRFESAAAFYAALNELNPIKLKLPSGDNIAR